MRCLLDTHALLWWTHQPASLSRRAQELICDGGTDIFVSAVSAMEIAIKHRKRRLEFDSLLVFDFVAQTALDGFKQLPVTADHAQLAGGFDYPHADPWDRLLAAQARVEAMTLITRDPKMAGFGVATFW